MKVNIYYNVNGDYGLKYGLGHIYRAIEIIKKLKKKNIRISIITDSPNKIINFIKKETKLKIIKRSCVKLLKFNKSDLLINDTLGKDLEINSFFEGYNSKIINLDITKLNFKKGIVINSIIHYKKKIKVSRNIKYFGGFKYLIIRNFFKEKNKKTQKKNIFFVSSGGADYNNFSIKICSILLKLKVHKIYLMLGKAVKNVHIKKIKSKFKKKKIKILFNINNPKKYLNKSKFAIVSGGNVLFESLSSNCLVMAVQNYFHQSYAIRYLARKRCIINLGPLKKINKEKLYKHIQIHKEDLDSINSNKRRRVIDYKGLDRVVNIIFSYIKY